MKRRTLIARVIGAFAFGSAVIPYGNADVFDAKRTQFVEERLSFVRNERVKDAFRKVRREAFCLPDQRNHAYEDRPLPIGLGQTISQPSLVAYMTDALELSGDEKVLEIGTGSGFQAAILAELTPHVFSIEILGTLADRARDTLQAEGYPNVQVRTGDGYLDWPEEAPFDAIILTAAPRNVPQALLDQLRPGTGRLLVPEGPQGPEGQMLNLYRKRLDGGSDVESLMAVRFVPMVHGRRGKQ